MKKSLIKNNIKSIIRTRRRFISILVMAFLGVGFYSGLVATGPDMTESLDKYADSTNLYDINVVSTLGLTDDDINSIKAIEGVENAYGLQTKDSIIELDEKENVCKVIEYNENINVPVLMAGNLPTNSNECLLDNKYIIDKNIEEYIGKTIILKNEETNEETNEPIFTQKELKIVGIVQSPLYISSERGNTSIGSGDISLYIYVKDDVINMDYYTEICATVKGTKDLTTNSNKYLETVEPVIEKIENIKEERQEARYNQLVNEANQKLNDAQKEYDDKKLEIENELADAEKKLNDGKNEIQNSEIELQNSEKEIQTQEANAQKQFANAEKQIKEAESQITQKSKELEQGKSQLENSKKEVEKAIEELDAGISQANAGIKELEKQKEILEQNGIDTTQIDKKIEETQNTIKNLQTQRKQAQNQIKEAESQITSGEKELQSAKKELETQKNKLESSKKTTNTQIANAKSQITKGKQELETAKAEIAQKEQELQDAKNEANQKLNEAQQELNDAKDKVNQIEKATWYIQDRTDNTGYTNILDAIKTISNIAKLFPEIFYIVAVLISLTSMTRMIEEERIEIGTLKSLGYTNRQIISKYIIYSSLACIIGGIIGMTVGFYLLPNIVWNMYSMLYQLPQFYTLYQFDVGITGILLAFICIGGATIFVAYRELKETPAALMRPKPPKNGKKILLERIKFIWKRLNFSKKITTRNIFRYKKRAIMTIVGIAGCTGLILTGFGIKDSIIDIPTEQYGNIFKYESAVSLSNTDGLNDLEQYLNSNENIENYNKICATTGKLKNENSDYDVTIFVPEQIQEFENVCNLISVANDEKLSLSNDGIIITDKVAEFLNVTVGDEVTLVDSDNIEYKFKVTGIARNYVSHYVFISKEFYETNMKSYKTNMLLINTKDMEQEKINTFSEDVLKIKSVASVTMISGLKETISDMLSTIDSVVVILVVASALLAFVVLYNLANINIGERQREIATLKVLGFYDREVDNYINKENMIFTVIGILIGLVFGTFLTYTIMGSIEIDTLRFMTKIFPLSYLYASMITLLFSLIVNFAVHFVLKKIDMIESLKSVE